MYKKRVATILSSVSVVGMMLIIGCAGTPKKVHYGKPVVIKLISFPENAAVTLDETVKGFTPMLLEVLYLQAKQEIHPDETRKRLLKIEKDGYEPYVLSFSPRDKEYEKIPSQIVLKKKEKPVTKVAGENKSDQKTRETLEEKTRDEKALQDFEQLKKENKKLREQIVLLREREKTQGDRQKEDVRVESNPEPVLSYTIQTGSFLDMKQAQKEFMGIIERLHEKEIDYLRIEKVGRYYSVRIGKFENRKIARKILRTIKPHVVRAIVLKAYIKDERITTLYKKEAQTLARDQSHQASKK